MPDRAVLLTRQGDGALDLVRSDLSRYVEAKVHTHEPMGILGRTLRAQVGPEATERLPAALQDVRDVDGHAAGEGQGQGLHRRRAGTPIGVDDNCILTCAAVEAEVAVPGQLDLDRWLVLSQAGPSWP